MFSGATLHPCRLNDLQYDSDPQRVQPGQLVEYKETVLEVLREHDRENLMLLRDQLVQTGQSP